MSKFTEQQEDELYNLLKDLPDFKSLPLPARWYKKYTIEPLEAGSSKEFLDSAYTIKMMFAPKDLPPIIINEPQRDASGNIKLVKLVEPEPIDIKIVSRPYDANAKPFDISGNKLFLEDKVFDLSGDVLVLKSNDQSSHNDGAVLPPEVQAQDLERSCSDEPFCH
jgi:hypothetical protein